MRFCLYSLLTHHIKLRRESQLTIQSNISMQKRRPRESRQESSLLVYSRDITAEFRSQPTVQGPVSFLAVVLCFPAKLGTNSAWEWSPWHFCHLSHDAADIIRKTRCYRLSCVPPKDRFKSSLLEPMNATLFGGRVLTDVIRLRGSPTRSEQVLNPMQQVSL